MTTYAFVNLFFLALIIACIGLYTKRRPKKAFWYTLLVVLLMTLVFDSIFILLGIFEYDPNLILGLHLWKAPVEDFAYTIASVVIIGLLWEHYEAKEAVHEN